MGPKQTILIMCDTQRRDMLGCYYGDDVHTPNLDRLDRPADRKLRPEGV